MCSKKEKTIKDYQSELFTALHQPQWNVQRTLPCCQLSAELSCYLARLAPAPAELWQSLLQCCDRYDESDNINDKCSTLTYNDGIPA